MKRLYEERKKECMQQNLFSCYQQLSERDILELQDIFLINGIHRVVSYDLFTGRTLVDIFLEAMPQHHHEKACLTLEGLTLDSSVLDLYTLLQLSIGEPQADPAEYLEEFFAEQLYADFLWIEETATLRTQPWYPVFLELLSATRLDHHMPILIFSYETGER